MGRQAKVTRTPLLCAALILALGGVLAPTAPARTGGKVSAQLTKKSFAAAQAGQVKLVYKFSSKSARFAYVLSQKKGKSWITLRAVNRRGSFRGSHNVTVKQLFGGKAVKAGQYRVKVSADANSVTLSFTVLGASTPPPASRPQTGSWQATGLSGPVGGGQVTATNVYFHVMPDQATVSGFGFGFDYAGTPKPMGSCSGSSSSTINPEHPSPITAGQFTSPSPTGSWSGAGSGTFAGTFDSATSAHGTAQLSVFINGPGCFVNTTAQTGVFSWTASWQSP